jgi:hypothetical protein
MLTWLLLVQPVSCCVSAVAVHGAKTKIAKIAAQGSTERCYGTRRPALRGPDDKLMNLAGSATGQIDRTARKVRGQESTDEVPTQPTGLRREATNPVDIGIKSLYFLLNRVRFRSASCCVSMGSQEAQQMMQCRGEA